MKERRIRLPLLVLGLALVLIAAGCSTSGNNNNAGSPEAASPATSAAAPSESAAAATSETIVVKHAMGEATIDGVPSRVVVLDNGALDNVLALGVKPVGAPTVQLDNPFPAYLTAQTDGITNIGTIDEPNLETISSLKPDVILGSKDTHEAIYDKLEQIAPTVFVDTLGYTWKENLKLQAQAIGKPAEGDKLLADYTARLEEFKGAMGDSLATTDVSILRPRADHVRIYLRQSFSGIIIEDAGLPRPDSQKADEFSKEATEEQIADLGGDVILWFTRDTDHLLKSKLENNTLWKNLDAVKNNKVHEVDAETWLSGLGVQAANKVVDDLFKYMAESK
ncbi:ABC transporter substrate-binding protein [Cohnella panacarvi]|uniref:ABC transporter substrate-binding protein n=1 Tax=Cohnella panacarvi TaxID=400776 RepID=UPI00047C7C23|nr:iron-siderophore ABC transporter substrate-binding protein [Cohnella panacarvi]